MTTIMNNRVGGNQAAASLFVKQGNGTQEKPGFEGALAEILLAFASPILPNDQKDLSVIEKEKGVTMPAQSLQELKSNGMLKPDFALKGNPESQVHAQLFQFITAGEKKQNKLEFIKHNLSFKEFLGVNEISEAEKGVSGLAQIEQSVDSGSSEYQPGLGTLPMSKTEQYVLHIGSTDKGMNEEKFMRDFQQLLGRSSFTQNGQHSKLMIKLFPEHLGALKIEIVKGEHGMTAKMVASTQQAKELLESQLSSLKQAFTNQQIHVERLEIQQQFQPFEKFMSQGFQQHGQSGQERNKQQAAESEQEDEENNFLTTFEEALFNFNV